MHVPRLLIAVALIGSTLAIATPMAKADVTLGATNRGWIRDSDFLANESGPAMNYIVGTLSGIHFRDWFVFDLTGLLTPIASAELLLDNPSIFSDDGFEVYQLTSTTSTPATLIAAGGGAGVFGSLGTGTVFSTITVYDPADDGATLSLALNAAGIAFLNANLGGLVAFSGRVTTLDASPTEALFGSSGSAAFSTDLHLTPIPAPGAALLAMMGLPLVGWFKRRFA